MSKNITVNLDDLIASAIASVSPYVKQFMILADLRTVAKESLDVIRESQSKTAYKRALKAVKAGIVKSTGIDAKRVSEAFVSLGHRERAPKQSTKVEFSLEQLEVLMTLACDEFGETAAAALREAAKEVVKASKEA